MNQKSDKVTGDSLGQHLPRVAYQVNDIHSNVSGGENKVSIQAVKNVADQYGIDVTIFLNWLETKGYRMES